MGKTNNSKKEFIELMRSQLDSISSDKEAANSYLAEQGFDPTEIASEGLRRIKKLQLKINADKTKNEMVMSENLKEKAKRMVANLLANPDFSFPSFAETHQLSMQNCKFESFTEEDVKSALINYFYLKFIRDSRCEVSDE